MKTYEITLNEFDGSTDKFLILWVASDCKIRLQNHNCIAEVREIPVDPDDSAIDLRIDSKAAALVDELLTFANWDDDGDAFFCKEYDLEGTLRKYSKEG